MTKQEIMINLFESMDWIQNVADDTSESHIQEMIHAISEAITIIDETIN